MAKVIRLVVEADKMQLHEYVDGFWLYDDTRGMNLAMRAKTEQAAFIDALEYYQKRLLFVEKEYNDLKTKVDAFVGLFPNED